MAVDPAGKLIRYAAMRIRLLGSAAGKPVPRPWCGCRVCAAAKERGGMDLRSRTAAQVFLPGDGASEPRFQVDLSRDTAHHMLRDRFNLDRLECLLFTHADEDHLDPTYLKYRRTVLSDRATLPTLAVVGSEAFCRRLKMLVSESDLEAGRIRLRAVSPFERFTLGEIEGLPLPATHTDDGLNYVLQHGGRCVLVAWDTGLWPEENWRRLHGLWLDAVFMECTVLGPNTLPRNAKHLCFATLLEMKLRLAEAGCIGPQTPFVACHIGDNGGLTHAEAVAFAAPHGVIVGYDGLEIEA